MFICLINIVLFDIEVMNGLGSYIYNWEVFVGGIVGSNDIQDIMGIEFGSYVFIVIDDVSGCQDSLIYEIIEDFSDLVINMILDSSISCVILQIELIVSSFSIGNFSFEWFDSDNNLLLMGVIVILLQVGIYIIMLIELDNNCIQMSMVNIIVDILWLQVVVFILEELICENDIVVLVIEEGLDYYFLCWCNGMGEDLFSIIWIQEVDEGGGYILMVIDDRNGC